MSSPQQPLRPVAELLDSDARQLACGADVDELLEQAAAHPGDELNDHQRQCPYCQAALREFAQLWQPVRALAAEPVTLPAALRAAVASQVRRLVADVWYTLQLTDIGAIRIASRVVAAVARDTARAVPGVRVALGSSTHATLTALVEKATRQHRHPHAAVGVLGRTAVIDLAVAVTYGDCVDEVAREVQRRVIAELRNNIGLQDVAVNITVDDIID